MLKKEEHLIIHDTAREVESYHGRIIVSEVSGRSDYELSEETVMKYLAINHETTPCSKKNG